MAVPSLLLNWHVGFGRAKDIPEKDVAGPGRLYPGLGPLQAQNQTPGMGEKGQELPSPDMGPPK